MLAYNVGCQNNLTSLVYVILYEQAYIIQY
jgi:hypothetical protein